MRIPSFIKNVIKFCDHESSRYALGGVKCESDGTTSSVIATDGRRLVHVTYKDEEAKPIDVIVNGAELAKAATATALGKKSKGSQWIEESGGEVYVRGNGSASASITEGRFPRWRDVIGGERASLADHTYIKLNAKLLKEIAELYASLPCTENATVDCYIPHDHTCGAFFYGKSNCGDEVRVVLMPMAADNNKVPEFPGVYTGTPVVPEPTPVVEDEQPEPEVQAPAPPPELVDEDILAASLGECLQPIG